MLMGNFYKPFHSNLGRIDIHMSSSYVTCPKSHPFLYNKLGELSPGFYFKPPDPLFLSFVSCVWAFLQHIHMLIIFISRSLIIRLEKNQSIHH